MAEKPIDPRMHACVSMAIVLVILKTHTSSQPANMLIRMIIMYIKGKQVHLIIMRFCVFVVLYSVPESH